MKELKEIRDDQIRILGEGGTKNPLPRSVWIIILSVLGVALIGVIILYVTRQKEEVIQELKAPEPALFEPVREPEPILHKWIGEKTDSLAPGYTEIRDTLINDIPIRIFILTTPKCRCILAEWTKRIKVLYTLHKLQM